MNDARDIQCPSCKSSFPLPLGTTCDDHNPEPVKEPVPDLLQALEDSIKAAKQDRTTTNNETLRLAIPTGHSSSYHKPDPPLHLKATTRRLHPNKQDRTTTDNET